MGCFIVLLVVELFWLKVLAASAVVKIKIKQTTKTAKLKAFALPLTPLLSATKKPILDIKKKKNLFFQPFIFLPSIALYRLIDYLSPLKDVFFFY